MAEPPPGKCWTCGKETTKRCSKCAEGMNQEDVTTPTYYCGKDCQTADFKAHKAKCRQATARKQLYRGGDFLQDLFYFFREEAFDIDIVDVKSQHGKLHTYEPAWNNEVTFPYFKFPGHLVTNQEDKFALLTMLCCNEPAAYMHKIVKKVFEDGIDTGYYGHDTFYLPLKTGETYVLDLAGAQYGQYRSVVPYRFYKETYCDHAPEFRPFGTAAGQRHILDAALKGQCKLFGADELQKGDPRVKLMLDYLSRLINLTIEDWEVTKATSLAVLFNKRQELYHAESKHVKEGILSNISAWMGWWQGGEGPSFRQTTKTHADASKHTTERTTTEIINHTSPEVFFEKCLSIASQKEHKKLQAEETALAKK
ncbi:uncharacterized protein LTR77_010335 [Saxophila tyrrhenica]|uniref:MYND-type domain-containing protein n=1 Tax=Saxophila tyrrhenica TaxID=1690608 RepID=A0AAV9NWR9_9PEZI|nr:hypothetical protein LTR77_010335 [Saxophila tyrrhenica]